MYVFRHYSSSRLAMKLKHTTTHDSLAQQLSHCYPTNARQKTITKVLDAHHECSKLVFLLTGGLLVENTNKNGPGPSADIKTALMQLHVTGRIFTGRILVMELILPVIPENVLRWRERFSFVDIAMLQGNGIITSIILPASSENIE